MQDDNHTTLRVPTYSKIRNDLPIERLGSEGHLEEEFGIRKKNLSHRILVLGLIVSPLFLVAGLWLLSQTRRNTQSSEGKTLETHIAETNAQSIPRTMWSGLQPRQVAENFLKAKTLEERLKWVLQPVEVANIVEEYYRYGQGASETMALIRNMDDIETEEGLLARFMVEMKDGSERLLFVPYFEGGVRGIDFKSYSAHCSHPWNAILEGSFSSVAEVRVNLEPVDYYNFKFVNEKEWACYAATSPNLDHVLYFYAQRDDPALQALNNYEFPNPLRFTVSIESIERSHQNRQWRLKKVLFPGWVEPINLSKNK